MFGGVSKGIGERDGWGEWDVANENRRDNGENKCYEVDDGGTEMLGVRHRLDLFAGAGSKECAGDGKDVPKCEAQRKGSWLHQERRNKSHC